MEETLPHTASAVVPVPRLSFVITRQANQRSGRALMIDREHVRIGSHPSNDVVLDDRQVSRFHCSLKLKGSSWCLTDSGSLSGTFLSGVRVRDAELSPGRSELALGESLLEVSSVPPVAVVKLPNEARFGELVGASLSMRRVFALLTSALASERAVLVLGESGTGKQLVAQELARQGSRASVPLLTVDIGAVSSNLLESELFGHVKGAFAGADRARVGAFEAAQGGTLFLRRVSELPLDMQPKLLRALEAREIRRVGESVSRKVDARVVASSHRSLEREVNLGRFLEDLYLRLSAIAVELPPLRERAEDIPMLVQAFLERMRAHQASSTFTDEVFHELARHDWPGNVRELRNYVERALEDARALRPGASELDEPFKVGKERVVEAFERAYLQRLMSWSSGNVSRAARKAKIDRMYLHRLLVRYGIQRDSSPEL
jgi:DNA-binding NtrC family response regulator